MEQESESKYSREDTCLFHIIALKYEMAGDTESDELIQQLEKRLHRIDWSNPEFIKFSDAMRNGASYPISQDQEFSPTMLKAVVHTQGELLAALSENAKIQLIQQNEAEKKVVPALQAATKILVYLGDLLDLQGRMRERLHALGEDTSIYELPRAPFPI